jgi:hypothetical protein
MRAPRSPNLLRISSLVWSVIKMKLSHGVRGWSEPPCGRHNRTVAERPRRRNFFHRRCRRCNTDVGDTVFSKWKRPFVGVAAFLWTAARLLPLFLSDSHRRGWDFARIRAAASVPQSTEKANPSEIGECPVKKRLDTGTHDVDRWLRSPEEDRSRDCRITTHRTRHSAGAPRRQGLKQVALSCAWQEGVNEAATSREDTFLAIR